jgi:type IV secretory pathway VirB10-like protein
VGVPEGVPQRDDLRQPDPPPATRLNRLAVVVAAGIMSATLLVVAFSVGGESGEEAEAREQQAEAQSVRRATSGRSFYDRPLGADTLAVPVDPVTGLSDDEYSEYAGSYDAGTVGGNAYDGYSQPTGVVPPPYGRVSGAGASSPYGSSGNYHGASYASQPQQPSEEEQALDRAKRSALAPQGVGLQGAGGFGPAMSRRAGRGEIAGSEGPGGAAGTLDPVDAAYLETLSALENVMMAGGQASVGPPGSSEAGAPSATRSAPGGQGTAMLHPSVRAGQFVREAVAGREAGGRYIATTIERPISPYEIREGTLVEAYLITGIHSDLPGELVAQVSRNVYDSETQQVLLVPRGTRLIGTYDNQIAVDQSRLLVAWTRMVFPDGRSVTLPGLGAKDGTGASGLTGRVNRHYWQAFGNAMMLAVVGGSLSYAASRSRPPGGAFGYPTPGEVMAGSVATELSRVATEILRGSVMRRPTIQIPAGTRFNVFMNGDLALAPYAAEDGFMDRGRRPATQRVTVPVAQGY